MPEKKYTKEELIEIVNRKPPKKKELKGDYSSGAILDRVGKGFKGVKFRYRSPKPFSYDQVTKFKKRIGFM